MKRFINILLTTACAAALFSCTHKYSFKTTSYVIVEQTTFSVKEDAGLVRIPVSAFNSEGLNGSVYFKVNDGTAVQGTDFTIEPASGVLTFNGNSTEYIQVSVIEHPGELTGALKFSIELTSVSGDITDLGGITAATVEIQDNDVVVDWDFVAGEWTATDDGSSKYDITITKESETTLKLKNIWDEGSTITGTITFDKASNSANIVFEGGQVVYTSSSYGPCGIYGISGNSLIDCPATVTGSGIIIGPWYAIILTGEYAGYYFSGSGGGYGGVTTLIKK
jgi:Calx-beta domain.